MNLDGHDSGERRVLVASICAYNIASFSWWAQPVIVNTLLASPGEMSRHAGGLVSIELTAVAVVAFMLAPLVSRMPVVFACFLAGMIAVAANAISGFVDSYQILFGCRAVAGIAEGVLLALGNAMPANMSKPGHAYALLTTWNVAAGVALLVVLTALGDHFGATGVFLAIAAACLSMIPYLGSLPRRMLAEATAMPPGGLPSVLGLAVMATWGTASAMLWAYMIPIGLASGVKETVASLVAAVAAGGGLVGGAVAAYIATKTGRLVPMIVALFLETVIFLLLTHGVPAWMFIALAPTAIALVYFLLPMLLAMAADFDRSGSLAAAMAAMFVLNGGLGPLIGGYIVSRFGLGGIGWAMLFCATFATACVTILHLHQPRQRHT